MNFIRKFLAMNDQWPTCERICDAFGWASPNAASEVQLSLERKGALVRNELDNLMFARPGAGLADKALRLLGGRESNEVPA